MSQILAGAQLDRAPGPKYLDALRFAEIAFGHVVPKAATVSRWRADLPEDLQLSVVCPQAAWHSEKGPLRPTDAMNAAQDKFRRTAIALRANVVVLPTGGDMTTGQRDRDLLTAYIARFDFPPETKVAWHPSGLWDLELAIPFAKKLGVILAVDPLEAELIPGPTVYCRLRAIGLRTKFSETLLLDVVDRLKADPLASGYVAIESPRSFQEASRLAALLLEA